MNSTNLHRLDGMRAMVTGATGNLGRAMSRALAEAGASVLVNSRSREQVSDLVEELRKDGLLAESAVFDVTSSQQIGSYFEGQAGKPLSVLVNNAYAGGAGSTEMVKDQGYRESYEVVVVSAHNVLSSALTALRLSVNRFKYASVINVASMYGMVSPDQRIYAGPDTVNPPYYGAAKAALIQWGRYAANEFGPEGIRVNTLSPGPFPSEAVQASDPEFVSRLVDRVPMGRIGAPEDLAGPVLFLASPASGFVNGANLVVDGGWTCR